VISFALGALLDFPELLRIAEVQAHLSLLVGDLAAAVAALLSEVEGHGHAHGSPSFSWSPEATERYIARVPGSLKDFTRTRIFAPQHADIDVARVELFANFDKLRRMELTKQSSGMINEIERAQKEGDFDQELELLKEQASRARKRHGL
jgi:hypothetical protein